MLDATFKFSQHSLSDFADCPRRFYLHYVAHQAWPLVETGPTGLSPLEYQRYLWRGTVLHRWIERHWLGLPPQPLTGDVELDTWWLRFADTDFSDLPLQRLPELALVAPLDDHLLYARFDLLAYDAVRAVIIDWKTLRGDGPPRYDFMARRFQTRIYLYVLATAGAAFNDGQPFAPEQCSMRYWLANFPEQPWVDIPYSSAEYERDRNMLRSLMDSATQRDGEVAFEMTEDERKCTYCTFRTLCKRRGAPSAEALIWDEDTDVVEELEY